MPAPPLEAPFRRSHRSARCPAWPWSPHLRHRPCVTAPPSRVSRRRSSSPVPPPPCCLHERAAPARWRPLPAHSRVCLRGPDATGPCVPSSRFLTASTACATSASRACCIPLTVLGFAVFHRPKPTPRDAADPLKSHVSTAASRSVTGQDRGPTRRFTRARCPLGVSSPPPASHRAGPKPCPRRPPNRSAVAHPLARWARSPGGCARRRTHPRVRIGWPRSRGTTTHLDPDPWTQPTPCQTNTSREWRPPCSRARRPETQAQGPGALQGLATLARRRVRRSTTPASWTRPRTGGQPPTRKPRATVERWPPRPSPWTRVPPAAGGRCASGPVRARARDVGSDLTPASEPVGTGANVRGQRATPCAPRERAPRHVQRGLTVDIGPMPAVRRLHRGWETPPGPLGPHRPSRLHDVAVVWHTLGLVLQTSSPR